MEGAKASVGRKRKREAIVKSKRSKATRSTDECSDKQSSHQAKKVQKSNQHGSVGDSNESSSADGDLASELDQGNLPKDWSFPTVSEFESLMIELKVEGTQIVYSSFVSLTCKQSLAASSSKSSMRGLSFSQTISWPWTRLCAPTQ